MSLLPWLLSKRAVLSGLRNTTFESFPAAVNGLPVSGVKAPVAATDHASVIEDADPPSAAYRSVPSQLNSTPPISPVPAFANGDPTAAASEPSALLIVNTDTDAWFDTARKRPSPEIFIPTRGEGSPEAVADKLNAPFTPTLNVLITPLLEAIKNLPSGVDAREIPAQLSSV